MKGCKPTTIYATHCKGTERRLYAYKLKRSRLRAIKQNLAVP